MNVMSSLASQRLIDLAKKHEACAIGISVEATGKIEVAEQVKADILTCLYDTDHAEVGWGLWFCKCLLKAGKLDRSVADAIVQRLPSLIKSDDQKIRAETVEVLVLVRDRVPEYRNWMLQCMRDKNPTVRWDALLNSQTFLKPKEIEPLLAFKDDDYLTETSMGSPLVYILRNEALDRMEKSLGKTFERRQLSEVVEGGETALWWDWKPFLDWWEKRQNRWRFWRAS